MKNKFLLLLLSLIVLQSCDKDPDPKIQAGAAGYFVVNEGGFGKNNTSLSFYDRSKDAVENDVFTKKNSRPLGDQTQSVTVFNGKAYVVVQHSSKIEVINADDYTSLNTISEGIESPRYFIGVSDTKGYLSDWGSGVDGSIKVIDLTSMKVTKEIKVGVGPNEMILKDGNVYVVNSGGFSTDNTVSVINTSDDTVTSTITVGDNPMSLQFDKDGNLWVASSGLFAYDENYDIDVTNSTKSSISKITGGKEVARFEISEIVYPGAAHLNINTTGDNLYFIFNGAIYSMPVTGVTPTKPLIGDKYFYGMAVDPITNEIIACEAPDFSSPGNIYIYNSSGIQQKTFKVGIAPNGIGFK